MKIKYEFLTGEVVEVEVADRVGDISMEIERTTYNSNRKTRGHKSFDSLLEQGIQIAATHDDLTTAIEFKETMESIRAALEQLLPRQRNLVRKIFFDGESVSEVARREGVSEGAIRDRLRKIYKNLKKILE